jgi:hypothetical protein
MTKYALPFLIITGIILFMARLPQNTSKKSDQINSFDPTDSKHVILEHPRSRFMDVNQLNIDSISDLIKRYDAARAGSASLTKSDILNRLNWAALRGPTEIIEFNFNDKYYIFHHETFTPINTPNSTMTGWIRDNDESWTCCFVYRYSRITGYTITSDKTNGSVSLVNPNAKNGQTTLVFLNLI